jgi:hypothetical protein
MNDNQTLTSRAHKEKEEKNLERKGDMKTYNVTETSTDHQKKTWKGGELTACMPLPQAL